MNKKCVKCGKVKRIELFYKDKTRKDGYFPYCKECSKIEIKSVYNNNKLKKINYQKLYYQNHKLQKQEYDKIYRQINKEKRNLNENKLYATNNLYKQKKLIRGFITKCFLRRNVSKNIRTEKILGCSYNDFIKHLMVSFKNNYGYEWDGIEKVHVDHIIPLATAKNTNDVVKLCHYTNLQLLKAKDNLQKSCKLNYMLGGE